jgi:hypothetical protein
MRHMIRYETSDFFLIKDLSSLFNWNTKQLFVYLEAEYTNAKGVSKHKLFEPSMIVPRSGTTTRHRCIVCTLRVEENSCGSGLPTLPKIFTRLFAEIFPVVHVTNGCVLAWRQASICHDHSVWSFHFAHMFCQNDGVVPLNSVFVLFWRGFFHNIEPLTYSFDAAFTGAE